MRPFWSAGPAGKGFPLIGGAAPRAASLSRALPAARAAPAAALARQRGPSWAPFLGTPFPSRAFDSCASCRLHRSLLPTPLSCLLECRLLCLPPQVWPSLQSCLNQDSIWPLPQSVSLVALHICCEADWAPSLYVSLLHVTFSAVLPPLSNLLSILSLAGLLRKLLTSLPRRLPAFP